MLRAALFDVDGTLLDSVEHRALAWCDALREFGPNPDPVELVPWVTGPEGEVARRFLEPAILAEATLERVVERYRDHWENVHAPRVAPIAGGKAIIEELASRGLRVVLATRAHHGRIADVLKALGFAGATELSVGSETDGPVARAGGGVESGGEAFAIEATGLAGTPAEGSPREGERAVIEHALRRAEAAPAEVVAIVATPREAKAATALGLRVITLLSGGGKREELEAAGAEKVFLSPQELRENLGDLAPLGFPTDRHEAPRSPYDGPTDEPTDGQR